jgi:hypothetical protein
VINPSRSLLGALNVQLRGILPASNPTKAVMTPHKFKIGDIVTYVQPWGARPVGPYDIIRLLPSDGPDPAYRLKSQAEKHERIAKEYELRTVDVSAHSKGKLGR